MFSILWRIYNVLCEIKEEARKANTKLEQLVSLLLQEPPIAGATLTFEGVPNMLNAKLFFSLLDDGTGTGNIAFTDKFGELTNPPSGAVITTTLITSNPILLASVDATGLVVTISLDTTNPLPNPLPTGLTVTASISIANPDGSTTSVTAVSDAINVVAGGVAGATLAFA